MKAVLFQEVVLARLFMGDKHLDSQSPRRVASDPYGDGRVDMVGVSQECCATRHGQPAMVSVAVAPQKRLQRMCAVCSALATVTAGGPRKFWRSLRSEELDEQSALITDQYLQIGEVADRVGLSMRTVRYYEEMGLIVPADRSEGGFRLYTADHVERLALIKQMKPLGFTVQEIGELLDASDVLASGEGESDAREAASARLGEFSRAAAERVDELREQLERAEDFAKRLRGQVRRGTKSRVA